MDLYIYKIYTHIILNKYKKVEEGKKKQGKIQPEINFFFLACQPYVEENSQVMNQTQATAMTTLNP